MRSIRERILKAGYERYDPLGPDTVAVRSIRERILKVGLASPCPALGLVAVRSIRERILKVSQNDPRWKDKVVAVRSIRERILKASPREGNILLPHRCSEVDPGEDTERVQG